VGAEFHGLFHIPFGDEAAERAGHVVGLQLAHHAAADVLRERGMHVKQGACVYREAFDPERGDLIHDHVEHMVPVAQVMVEGDGHAALEAAVADGFG